MIRGIDICAFSQFPLSECDSVAALIYSKDEQNGQVGNKWHYLCSEDKSKIHLFDSDYLSHWIELKGTEFIVCPLCKTGAEEKELIEEHQIDSMEQLKERRLQCKKENDIYMTFHVEQLILDKACTEIWHRDQNRNRLLMNQQILRDVLNHWNSKKKIDEFRDKIVESSKRCVGCDNSAILQIIIKYCNYDKFRKQAARNKEFIKFIEIAAECASFECLKILLSEKSAHNIDWSEQKRPVCLLNAIKYHHANIEMINFIMDALEKVKQLFVCDDIFTQIIKHDLVEIAKRVINNRWHKITEQDESLAEHINLGCSQWLKSRRSAFEFNTGDDDGLTLDDDDWGADDDDGFDEDDDWDK